MTIDRTILHPTDFSANAEAAFKIATELARDRKSRLLVLHVVARPLSTLGGTEALPPSALELGLDEAKAKLAAIQAPPGIPLDTRLEIGDPADVIQHVAQQVNCDMIVMGTHGLSGLARVLLGSVADRTIRHASCPVLTLRG